MILNLKFELEFTSTGKTFKGDHDFQTGLSSITGANEKGKSLRLEMIRYCLFGGEALRAETKNYKSISAEMTFQVAGQTYVVTRRKKGADLTKNGKAEATGTSPVNVAILKILGYDLEVFDVANACLQGEIEAMTNKRPAERKQMVDRTIGLDAIDNVLAKVGNDTSGTKKAIELLNEKCIQIFEPPTFPEGVLPDLDGIEKSILILEERVNRKHYLTGVIDSARCENPEKPVFTTVPVDESVEELQAGLQKLEVAYASVSDLRTKRESYLLAKRATEGHARVLIKKFIEEKYDEKWLQYHRYEQQRVEKPLFTQADIDLIRVGLAEKNRREEQHLIQCPNCKHEFDQYEGDAKLPDYDFGPYDAAVKLVGGTSIRELKEAEHKIFLYEKFAALPPQPEPDMPVTLNKPGLIPHIETLERFDADGFDIDKTIDIINEVNTNYDTNKSILTVKLANKKHYDEVNRQYYNQLAAYNGFVTLQAKHANELKGLEGTDLALFSMKEQANKLRAYNEALAKYEARQEAQSEALQTKAKLELNLELLGRVRKSLNELKPKVKSHLLPSLNHVASTLLSQMTNGQRTKIEVDENFEIMVDDQPVKTLSGSGKAVANLAVRIALGMVLTNKVFSVFLADEIDAAMDDERAAYTAQCLRNLTSTISQIILVSHKEPDADHQIVL